MSEKSITHLVKSITDNESAIVKLTTSTGQRTSCKCVFKESTAPGFFLLFPSPETISDVDLSKPCSFIGKNHYGQTLSFVANIVEKTNNRILELVAKRAIDPEGLREYFRVSLSTGITVSYMPATENSSQVEWELTGKVVDISQSGLLTILPEECKNTKSILIEIDLTEPCKTIYCIGHVTRIKRVRKDRWITAFHFDEISAKAVDDIAVNCLAEQRKQLREKIEIATP